MAARYDREANAEAACYWHAENRLRYRATHFYRAVGELGGDMLMAHALEERMGLHSKLLQIERTTRSNDPLWGDFEAMAWERGK